MNNDWLDATSPQPTQDLTIFSSPELTRKQRAFVQHLIDHPKTSPTKAALATYGTEDKELTYSTAGVIAHENLKNPKIIMALGDHAGLFESAIVGVVTDWKDSPAPRKREIALDAAKFGHDKIFGKSTVKIEQQTSVVQIAINLTGDGEAPPAEMLQAT